VYKRQIFKNDQVDLEQLPEVEAIDFMPLPVAYRNILLISGGLFFLFLLAGIVVLYTFAGSDMPVKIGWALGVWAFLAAFVTGRTIVTFPYRGYAVREKDIIYRKGWLWRSVTTVPFNRVQHCDIKQGLLERQFDLSSLNVYTAGGQNSDLTIPGLGFQTAERYKAYILKTISSDEEE
jgi:membrane protein YdbS with pleckstrin-like domain